MNGEIRIVDNVTQAFADLVASEAPSSIALSGGETAQECYQRLRGADVDWAMVDVYFGDERLLCIE
jgi:6-phosphogluconolactonase/glucosamine-6-phosphate isomerase/deaminase